MIDALSPLSSVRPYRRELLQNEYPVKHRSLPRVRVAAAATAFDIRTPFKGGHQCLAFDLSPPLSHFSSPEHLPPPSPRRRLPLSLRQPGTAVRSAHLPQPRGMSSTRDCATSTLRGSSPRANISMALSPPIRTSHSVSSTRLSMAHLSPTTKLISTRQSVRSTAPRLPSKSGFAPSARMRTTT